MNAKVDIRGLKSVGQVLEQVFADYNGRTDPNAGNVLKHDGITFELRTWCRGVSDFPIGALVFKTLDANFHTRWRKVKVRDGILDANVVRERFAVFQKEKRVWDVERSVKRLTWEQKQEPKRRLVVAADDLGVTVGRSGSGAEVEISAVDTTMVSLRFSLLTEEEAAEMIRLYAALQGN